MAYGRYAQRLKDASDGYRSARAARLERMWARAVRCWSAAGREPPKDPVVSHARKIKLIGWRVWELSGWRFHNELEAADLGRPDGFRAGPAREASDARPGSTQKVAAMAARCAAGEELWHRDDFQAGVF